MKDMKAKNNDGTWNVLDNNYNLETEEIGGWRKFPDSWLDGITRRGITRIELNGGILEVTYGTGSHSVVYFHNLVCGVWDSGIRFK